MQISSPEYIFTLPKGTNISNRTQSLLFAVFMKKAFSKQRISRGKMLNSMRIKLIWSTVKYFRSTHLLGIFQKYLCRSRNQQRAQRKLFETIAGNEYLWLHLINHYVSLEFTLC